MCLDVGRSKENGDGFYSQEGGQMVLNQGTRGRVIKPATEFPNKLGQLCSTWVEKARALDPSIPPMTPNTVLVNFYNEKAHFKWHKVKMMVLVLIIFRILKIHCSSKRTKENRLFPFRLVFRDFFHLRLKGLFRNSDLLLEAPR